MSTPVRFLDVLLKSAAAAAVFAAILSWVENVRLRGELDGLQLERGRRSLRPDDQTERVPDEARLSRSASPHPLSRYRNSGHAGLPDQQFQTACAHNRSDLSLSLADRIVFKWLKQHLRLRGFFSNTPNGVAVQIWTAICAYLLVSITRQENALPHSLHEILQVASISALEKVPLVELFANIDTTKAMVDIPIQLEINGF
jgi:hypothetical protein